MRTPFTPLLFAAALALTLATPTLAPAQDNGLKARVDQLQRDISALQQTLSAIQRTPGPQGPAGPQGPQGPQGVQGMPGTPSEVTVNVEGQGTAATTVPTLTGFEVFTQIAGIQGESTDKDHVDWIDTLGYSVGVTQSSTTGTGGGGGAGKASFDEFKILKVVDKASPTLFIDAASGAHISQAAVEIGRLANGNFQRTLKYVLQNVLISSVKPAGSSGGKLLEEVSLNFARVEITYYQYGADGSLVGTVDQTWDLLTSSSL